VEEAEDNNPADSRLIVAAYFDPPMGPEPLRGTRFLASPAPLFPAVYTLS